MNSDIGIRWPVRTLLTIIEPLFALNGAYLIMTHPDQYLDMMIRNPGPLIPHAKTTTPDLIYTQLAAGWIMFALLEAILLRSTRERRIWRNTCIAMLGSDAFHVRSIVQGAGGLGDWLRVWDWTGGEWKVALGSYPFLLARVYVVYRSYVDKGYK
jgi:hypothetical protein